MGAPRIAFMAGLVAAFLCPPAGAQELVVFSGVKLGFNISSLYGSGVDDSGSRVGLLFGGFARLGIDSTFAVQGEALLTMKGMKLATEGRDKTLDLMYLEFPVLGVYQFYTETELRPFVLAGPALGFNLYADDAFAKVEALDLGLVVGGGVESGPLSVEARYTLGLTSIDDSPAEESLRNGVLSVAVGYSF